MNNTNRLVNRSILFVGGLLFLVPGGAIIIAATQPRFTNLWSSWMHSAATWGSGAIQHSRISPSTSVSWFAVGALTACALFNILAIVVVARLGGGTETVLLRAAGENDAQGPITVKDAFATDAMAHALEQHREILTSRVATRRIRGARVLHVSVTPRQYSSPLDVASTVGSLVDNLAMLTGQTLPTYIAIHTGIRARIAANRSRVD